MLQNNELHIRELDLDMINPTMSHIESKKKSKGFFVTVIGKRGTGKSWIIRALAYAKRNIIPTALAFNGTDGATSFYSQFIPQSFVYNVLDTEKLKGLIKRQQIALKYIQNPWSLLILDDCFDEPKIFNDKVVTNLYKNGRHYNLLCIVGMQYALDIKPGLRTNIDGVFILRDPNMQNRKKIYENYAGVIPDFSLFCAIMDQVTNDHTALYIHNATNSNDWRDCIFWFKATEVDFRFGSADFWKFHAQRYNDDYQEDFSF